MENIKWKFDQTPNTAAITTKQVLENKLPIVNVVHYKDDHSWGFFCGTTNDTNDGRVISMQEALELDDSLNEIAHLKPGMKAYRKTTSSPWKTTKE